MRRAALGLATAAVAVACSLGLGELLVRGVVGPPAQLYYTGSFHDTQTDFDVVYGVTPEGRRRTCGPQPRGLGAARVGVIGDSFVFGQGVADCEDFVSLLNAASPSKRFENLGLIGAGIDHYALVARDLLDGFSEVTVLFHPNDVGHLPTVRSAAGRGADDFAVLGILRRAHHAWILSRVRKSAEERDGAVAFLGGRPNQVLSALRQDLDYFRSMVEPGPQQVAAFRARFAELAGLLGDRVRRGRVEIACVPEAHTVSPQLAALIREHGGSLGAFGEPSRSCELVRDLAREHGLRFLEVFEGFAAHGEELYHLHDLHWNPAGHRRMAELLAEPLGVPAPAASAGPVAEGAPVVPSAAP